MTQDTLSQDEAELKRQHEYKVRRTACYAWAVLVAVNLEGTIAFGSIASFVFLCLSLVMYFGTLHVYDEKYRVVVWFSDLKTIADENQERFRRSVEEALRYS